MPQRSFSKTHNKNKTIHEIADISTTNKILFNQNHSNQRNNNDQNGLTEKYTVSDRQANWNTKYQFSSRPQDLVDSDNYSNNRNI